jgi:hypothetical protein
MRSVVSASGYLVWACDTPSLTTVSASATSVQLLAPNDSRAYASVYNDSTSVLFLSWGPTASAGAFTTKVQPQGLYELPAVRGTVFVGQLSGAWASGNGSAKITEAS